ncbi:reverse transcriptase domain-containing protein [Tanacetum coccineum]
MISPAFVEANYEILKSLLRERRRQIRNKDLRTKLKYLNEEYDEEREMEPRREPRREATPTLRLRSLMVRRQRERVVRFEDASNREGNRKGRNAEGIRPSEIEAREGHQPSTNMEGNLPPNGMLLPHHAQPFISSSLHIPTGLVPILVNPYSQPSVNLANGQALNFLFQAQIGNPLQKTGSILNYEDLKAKFRSHFSQQKKFTKSHLAVHNIKQREDESTRAFITRYTNDTLQILGLHEEQRISGFVHGLRTRSLVEHLSTDLPSTYKGLMEKAYTWVEAREVATNGVLNNRKDDFKRSKKFSWGNNIEQKDKGRFSPYKGQNHKRLSNLVKSPREILATEKVAKTFEQPPRLLGANWSKDKTRYCHFHEDYGHETNQCQELKHQIEEAVKSGKLAHLVKGVKEKKEKTIGTRSEQRKKEEKKPTLDKVSVLMISGKTRNMKKRHTNHDGIGEITFPPLSNVGSSDPVIIKVYISGRQILRVYSNTPLVGFSGEQSWPLGEIPLEVTIREGPIAVMKTLTFVIVKSHSPHNLLLGRTAMQQMGIVVSTVHGAIKFHTPRGIGTIFSEYNSQKPKEEEDGLTNKYQVNEENVLSCIDTEERVVINDKCLHMDLSLHNGSTKSINDWRGNFQYRTSDKHVYPCRTSKAKEEKPSLGKNEAVHNQVEELTKAGILREVKYQTWVLNPMVVKKDSGKWKLRLDFTNINKAWIREPHPLPTAEQKAEGLHKYRLKCFLDAYKGYHQIPIAEKDEEKTLFFTREGVFCYKRLPFGLKNAGVTYQKLINKVFGHQMGRNMEVNVDDMVIISDTEEEMMADITETLERLRAINLKINPKNAPSE